MFNYINWLAISLHNGLHTLLSKSNVTQPTYLGTVVATQRCVESSFQVSLTHEFEFWKSKVFLDCITMDRSYSVKLIDDFAKFVGSIESFSNIEG